MRGRRRGSSTAPWICRGPSSSGRSRRLTASNRCAGGSPVVRLDPSSPNASPNAKSAQSAVSISRSFTTATRSTSEGELTCRIFPQAEPIDHRDFRRKRQKLRKADSTCRQLRCLGTLRRGSKRRAGELDCAREPDTATVHSRRTPTTARSTQCDRVSDVRVRQRANGSRRIHGCSAQVQGRGRGIAHNSGHRDIRTIVP